MKKEITLGDAIAQISKMSADSLAALNKITEEYTAQLRALQTCRDELIKQNSMLLEENFRMQQFIMDLAMHRAGTNVNIKQ